jgi:hypothetical protein
MPVLAQAWRATGFRGPPPPVWQGNVSQFDAAAIQPNLRRDVILSPQYASNLRRGSISPSARDYDALKVLLHEYAHVRQPEMQQREVLEGGAEGWANEHVNEIARKLWGPRVGLVQSPAQTDNWWPRYPQYSFVGRDTMLRERGQFGR